MELQLWGEAIAAAAEDFATDTDAVPWTDVPLGVDLKRLGALLVVEAHGTSGGGTTQRAALYLRVAIWICVTMVPMSAFALSSGGAEMSRLPLANAQLWVAACLVGVGLLGFSQALNDLPRALGPRGALARLAHGARLGTAVVEALARVRTQQRVVIVVCWAFIVPAILAVAFALAFTDFFFRYNTPWAVRAGSVVWSIGLALLNIFFLPCRCSWSVSMAAASELARDAVLDVVRNVRKTALPPRGGADTDHEREHAAVIASTWRHAVAEPALALDRGPLFALAEGWGYGLAALFVGCWSTSLASFFFGVNTPFIAGMGAHVPLFSHTPAVNAEAWRAAYLAVSLWFAVLPLGAAKGLASVSDACVMLMEELNARRTVDFACTDTEMLSELERHLQGLHRGRGLGVQLGDPSTGIVLDKAFLKTTLLQVLGAFTTVVPLVLALQPVSHEVTVEVSYLRVCLPGPEAHTFVRDCVTACVRATPQEVVTTQSDASALGRLDGNCTAVPAYCTSCLASVLMEGAHVVF